CSVMIDWKAFSPRLLFTRRLIQKFHIQLRRRAEQPDRVALRARIRPHVCHPCRTKKITAWRVYTRLALSVEAFVQAIFAFEQVAFFPGRVRLPSVIRMARKHARDPCPRAGLFI